MTKHLWNCDTSWRCVQALAVILTILLLPGPGGALDPGIDLLEALNLHSNLSKHPGVTISPSKVFRLSGLDRNLVLPAAVFHRAVEQIKKTSELTFSVVVKQEESNSGTIVSFSNGINRYLELQSSGRRDEIRFHYTHITAAGATEIETETFPYRLADDTEHKVSLTISGTEMQLFIDCHPLYKRVTKFLPDRNFSASNMQLFVGQRNSNSHYLFKGELRDLRLITSSYGYLSQCELMDAQCPTCGQFLELENALLELKQTMSLLTKRLVEAEKRVSYIEECDCKKSCLINGTTKNDGEAWDVGCSRCECRQGEVKCGPRPCPAVKCKHPVLKEGECCPVCLKSCYITKKDFEHGEIQILGCRNCSCVDGNMHCEFLQCPELKCPPEQQMSVTDECCKFCQGISSFPLALPSEDDQSPGDYKQQQQQQQLQQPLQQDEWYREEEQEQDQIEKSQLRQYEQGERTSSLKSSNHNDSGKILTKKHVAKIFSTNSRASSDGSLVGEHKRHHPRKHKEHPAQEIISDPRHEDMKLEDDTGSVNDSIVSMLVAADDRSQSELNFLEDQGDRIPPKDVVYNLMDGEKEEQVDRKDIIKKNPTFARESDAFR
uniref:VWFC domain-containing protein n=1 Tax=Anopheles atroparvus TaxID=41427 RepID=A0AAG5D1G7_ANOAO